MSRPIRIGLLAEGKTELGLSVNHINPQDGGKPIDLEDEGALHTLIRRELQLIGIEDCQFIHRHPTANERIAGEIATGFTIARPSYLKKTIISWKPEEVDMIVIVIDSDENVQGRQQALEGALGTIQEYHLDKNNNEITDQSIGGLAVKNFETWLLADSQAVENLLEMTLQDTPEDLETLSADKNARDFAKNILDDAISQSSYQASSLSSLPWEVRWRLAKNLDCQKIKDRCQEGYLPFINNLTTTATLVIERIQI